GKVWGENAYAYEAHTNPPHGTSILDVKDPKHPRLIAHLEVPEGVHSHKVRVRDNVMIVNYEPYGPKKEQAQGGLKIFDISDRSEPREIAFFNVPCRCAHRFPSDERYIHFSPEIARH